MIDDSAFKEIELKFSANNIKLSAFKSLMEELTYIKKLEISSWDLYYTHPDKPNEFIRFRDSNTPELTKKTKLSNNNNWKRIEVDLPLDPEKINEKIVDAWVKLEDFSFKKRLFKSCSIFWNDSVNFVYYIVFDENMKELGKFIEIECNKNSGLNEEEAFKEIKKFEQELVKLGITPQNRLKRSLFEMFVKE